MRRLAVGIGTFLVTLALVLLAVGIARPGMSSILIGLCTAVAVLAGTLVASRVDRK
jgi:hypothetical protein